MTRRGGPKLFCFGIGFSAGALIDHLSVADWSTGGTVRDLENAPKLINKGIDATLWEGGKLSDEAKHKLLAATHVLISVPPGDSGDPVINAASDTLKSSTNLTWLGYLSTTGVYGNTDGAFVDEKAPLNPSSARSERRVAAEVAWLDLFKNAKTPVHIFRLAGIYGPGRSVFNQIRKGTVKRINKPGHAFSRIHVDDIARILAASISRPNPGAIYNVCDNEPAPPAEVTEYACHLVGKEPPPIEDFDIVKERMTPMGLSFWTDNRRVDNTRIRKELGVKLRYPDYRAGLQAIFAEED